MSAIVDNFNTIAALLPEKPDKDTFWVIRVIGRKKDNPYLSKNSKFYKSYTVQSKSELMELKGKIIECAVKNRARAYFNPNARSWRKVALATLKRTAEYIASEDYSSVVFAADRCLDEGTAKDHKKIWVIDIDDDRQERVIQRRLEYLEIPVITKIPTVNGVHLLVNPFNPEDLRKVWNEDVEFPEIKKNNPTLLYYNRIWNDNQDDILIENYGPNYENVNL